VVFVAVGKHIGALAMLSTSNPFSVTQRFHHQYMCFCFG
jgi:hypothetical protein